MSQGIGGPELANYMKRSNEYWRQAKEHLALGHLEKATELAWGSVAERVKALALARSKMVLRSHRDLRDYVRKVANALSDKGLYDAFREAESLHVNFYESWLDAEDAKRAFANVEVVLARIDSYFGRPGSGP